MPESGSSIVVLVHGTWANDAAWTLDGSQLRTALASVCPNQIEFDCYSWSGSNSVAGRQLAAEGLASKLIEISDNASGVHFVIGHSHGGNVALKAVELANLFERFKIICLSTPFFYTEPKLYDEELIRHIAGSFAIISGCCPLIVWWVARKCLPWRFQGEWIFLALYALLVFVISFCLRKPLQEWKDAAGKQALIMKLNVPPSAKLLIVRSVGDEASSVINISQLFIPAIHFIHETSRDMQKRASEFKITLVKLKYRARLMWIGLASCFLLWATAVMSRVLHLQLLPVELVFLATGCAALAGLFVFFVADTFNFAIPIFELPIVLTIAASGLFIQTLSALAMIAIAVLAMLTMGRDALMLGLLYRSMAEPTPLGFWGLHQFVPKSQGGLNHSAAYEDPAALSILCEWVSSTLGCKDESV